MSGEKVQFKRPENPFSLATALIFAADDRIKLVDDVETVRVLSVLEAHTFNTVRAGNELFWSRENCWKTYRISSQDLSKIIKLRASDQIEIYWWAFVNYIYQFEEKSKLFINTYNNFAPFFSFSKIQYPGKLIRDISNKLRVYTAFRHKSMHEWHTPSEVIGQLPLFEFMFENRAFFSFRGFNGIGNIPQNSIFRMHRRDMHSKMIDAMRDMEAISALLLNDCRDKVVSACFRVNSYTQWAVDGSARLRFGT